MSPTPPLSASPHGRLSAWQVLACGAAIVALYQRPDFLIQLADQVWSCF